MNVTVTAPSDLLAVAPFEGEVDLTLVWADAGAGGREGRDCAAAVTAVRR